MSIALDARSIARALGGDVVGRDQVAAPGPGHSRNDRSLSVRLSATAPDGFLVNSHAGDDWRDCRDHVKHALGMPTGIASPPRPTQPAISFAQPAHDDRIDDALRYGRKASTLEERPPRPTSTHGALSLTLRSRRSPALASASARNARALPQYLNQ